MGLESFSYITSLNSSNPVHATDQVSQGDDHIRGVKLTLLQSFPNVNAAVNFTPTEANYVVGVTSGIQAQIDGKAATSHTHATSDITSGTMADARIAESNVTQHQAALSVTESQVSDLGSYIEPGDDIASLTITTLNIDAADTSITRSGAGKIEVEGKPIIAHNNGALGSGEIYFSTSGPSGGSAGDIWFKHEA